MYQTCNNDEDEFEPRTTPKPASKFDCYTLPSVPEVSLIFDKPLSCKTVDYNSSGSPYVEPKTLKYKNNVSSPLNVNGSYAAWKEQNYSQKPPTSKINDGVTPSKIQYCQSYATEPYTSENVLQKSNERIGTLRNEFYNSPRSTEKQIYRKSPENLHKHNYEVYEDNSAQVEKKHNIKTQCTNTIKHMKSVSNVPHVVRAYVNNCDTNEKEYSPLLYEKRSVNFEHHNSPFIDSSNEATVQNFPINSNSLKRTEFPLPQYLGQQYPYFNTNTYSFPQHHPCPPHSNESQETVKNLLQIINSQNEQIKSLQTQVDRLLKIQEESLREKKTCSCSFQIQQNGQSIKNNDNTLDSTSCIRVPQNSRQHPYQYESSKNKEISRCNDNENVNQTELILKETQSRQAFMEQKVSIGVMTSFEFTVQNSPFPVDIEDYERNEKQQEKSNLKLCNNVGVHDTGVAHEPLRRYKNSFNRIPSGQLENIVEDSESYMSSSQQQSSNLNASISLKDLDKQAYMDVRREIDVRRSESPKFCKAAATKINQIENTQKRLERNDEEETKNYEISKTPTLQRNILEYNTLENKNHRTNVPPSTGQHTKVQMQNDNDCIRTNNSINRSSSYNKNYQKEGQVLPKHGSCIEDSLILNGGDLKINERPPTPEPSIHVEMQEYSSDDDSEKIKRSSKVGWTFYNNVLGQVNQLLQNSSVIDDQQQDPRKVNQNERDETENRALDNVKVATLEQLKKLGISLSENPEHKESNNSNKMAFDSSFYPRCDYQANMTQATSAVNETNTSMHMKALALKYLTDEQLSELAIQRQGSASVKHLMLSNVQGTNMSFATMRYLERYQLLPGKNNVQTEDINKTQMEVPPKVDLRLANTKNSPALKRFPFTQTPRTTCPSKILDISTLKQQPKLL
ncbi:uncharacterized protein LOC116430481 [Nomia melanderi]|uniref:uncharacterized protein LOC116430481 n=1 Tax=Nomia melanderi TaxID=2448451 RepID=UPI001304015E|nr:uncharacterized protein LOC116430481 [Nomia melanderi]XP_031840568.1 uncharacterized protein LOC116430481 [Nomia melanderi]XP_031840578.1 uncharacterized protein LOC116430481 [Nomia melanderi]